MSDVKPCPDGMRWINPYLAVKDAEAAVAFYTKAFGFETRFTMTSPDGKIQHAELGYKDCVLMLGPEDPQQGALSPSTIGGTPTSLYVYTEDVDALCEQARAAGATIVQQPVDMFWGDRMCALVDPEGHKWAFATHVKDVEPAEMAQSA
jgi:PhnB protein